MSYPELSTLFEHIDISQFPLQKNMRAFLKKRNADENVIDSNGDCAGFTALWLFAKYISRDHGHTNAGGSEIKVEEKREDDQNKVNDINWLKKAYCAISSWDPATPLSPELEYYFEHIISYVSFFNNGNEIDTMAYQGNLEYLLQNTKGTQFVAESCFAACFNKQELENLLAKIPEVRLVYIGIAQKNGFHRIGLFKYRADNQKNSIYSIYDCNSKHGEQQFIDASDAASDLLSKFDTSNKEFYPIQFDIYRPILKSPTTSIPEVIKLQDLRLQPHLWYSDITPLFLAIMSRRLDEIQEILSLLGKDKSAIKSYVNLRCPVNGTPLNFALKRGLLTIARELLENGADPNAIDDLHETPLICASLHGNIEVVKELLEHHASPNIADNLGWTPLMHAACVGDNDIVTELLLHGADISKTNKDGWNALMVAQFMQPYDYKGDYSGVVATLSHTMPYQASSIKASIPTRLTVPQWWPSSLIKKLLRRSHPFVVDLTHANLADVDLRMANLSKVIITNPVKGRMVFWEHAEYAKYCDGNPKHTLKALLQKFYLCGEGSSSRFFSGAWNRAHIKSVQDLMKSDIIEDAITPIEQVIKTLLCNIQNSGKAFNKKGELHKILNFVLQYSKASKNINELIKEVNGPSDKRSHAATSSFDKCKSSIAITA